MLGRKRTSSHKIQLLAGVRLFSACTREELGELARLFDESERPAGTVLVREGDAGREFFVIVEGTATASVGGGTIAKLGPGDFFGEMSLLEHAPRSATVTADTDLELLVMDPRSFSSLVGTAPSVGMRMMRTLSERLRTIESAPVKVS
jgi:CRP-like cAMP-binding protein